MIHASLERLEYRGYDSVGVATVSGGALIYRKGKGRITSVAAAQRFDDLDGDVMIGHTRWATHGKPSDANAHPLVDCRTRVAVIHNGIIANYSTLKTELVKKAHLFKSETDTEVFAHLVEEGLSKGLSAFDAFRSSVNMIQGSYAIVVLAADEPDKLFFSKRNSPLVIGVGHDRLFVASDIPAFLEYTNRVIVLNDDELGYVSTRGEIHIENLRTGSIVKPEARIRSVSWTPELARKGGYPHYMIKEIHEQPLALYQTVEAFEKAADLEKAASAICGATDIFIMGAGTAFHAGLAGRDSLVSFAKRVSTPVVSSEYQLHSQGVKKGDVVIAVSQSGETIDTLLGAREFKARGAKLISVSNVLDSAIPREADISLYTRAGPEIGVASTKTFLTQLSVLQTLSMMVGVMNGSRDESESKAFMREMRELPTQLEENINLSEPKAKELALYLRGAGNMYCLSRGKGVPLAKEAALKIKEVSYIHAEAYEAGESKHGPISLVQKAFPVMFLFSDSVVKEQMQGNLMEMKSRGAFTIGVTAKGGADSELDYAFELDAGSDSANTILFAPPLQLTAYYAAIDRGLDPDKPRNLAKTVTVE